MRVAPFNRAIIRRSTPNVKVKEGKPRSHEDTEFILLTSCFILELVSVDFSTQNGYPFVYIGGPICYNSSVFPRCGIYIVLILRPGVSAAFPVRSFFL